MCISSAIAVCNVDILTPYFIIEAAKQEVGCLEITMVEHGMATYTVCWGLST